MAVNMITPQQASEMLAAGEAILIDVREPEEFTAEHIVYATSLPLGAVQNLFPKLNLPKGRKVIFHCLKGGRGQQACLAAGTGDAAGYDLYNIAGGLQAWKESGLPVISAGTSIVSSVIPVFRQVQIVVGFLVALLVTLGFAGFMLGFVLAGILGAALFMAGLTGWCGLAMLLNRMPWNRRPA